MRKNISYLSNNTPTIMVILGATGDLTMRKLMPSLLVLHKKKMLPSMFQLVGFSRRNLKNEHFQDLFKDIITDEKFRKKFLYQQGNFNKKEGYERLTKILKEKDDEWGVCSNKLFYLAVPPQYYELIFKNLAETGLTKACNPKEGWTRIIVEKPFGKNLKTAKKLDILLGKLFKEKQIYRIDHYLGKETVQNILAFRFSNSFLTPAWNKKSIESIHIKILEKIGVKNRGEFYDSVGALRDVGQNHILQLLALFTMKTPKSFNADSIRLERANVLKSLIPFSLKSTISNTVRGQYRGYKDVKGVNKKSMTETYFKIKTFLNLSNWNKVPIYLESGKGISSSRADIKIKFIHNKPCLCKANEHYTNVLKYEIQPNEKITISLWVKKPGSIMEIVKKDFSFNYKDSYKKSTFIGPYEKLILSVIEGDQTLFVSTAEIMASWKFIDSIIKNWKSGQPSLLKYRFNSVDIINNVLENNKTKHK